MGYFKFAATALLACLLTGWSQAAGCGRTVFKQDFNKYSGAYKKWTKSMAGQDIAGFISQKFDTYSFVGDGALRVTNRKGCVKTSTCGLTMEVRLPPMREATLSFRIKFQAGYGFARGGKLPGLCSDDCPTGCQTLTPNTGFSSRIMWREFGSLNSYMYTYDTRFQKSCGVDWAWNTRISDGKWMKIDMYIKTNSPGTNDGVHIVKVDGKRVVNNNIMYSVGGKKIQKFTFQNFHGGSGPEYASPKTQDMFFDDIMVREGNCVGGGSSDPFGVLSAHFRRGPSKSKPKTSKRSSGKSKSGRKGKGSNRRKSKSKKGRGKVSSRSGSGRKGRSKKRRGF